MCVCASFAIYLIVKLSILSINRDGIDLRIEPRKASKHYKVNETSR